MRNVIKVPHPLVQFLVEHIDGCALPQQGDGVVLGMVDKIRLVVAFKLIRGLPTAWDGDT